MSEPEVYMWVKEHPARFDPYEGGEPASTEFLDEPAPGAIALIRMDDPAIATLRTRVKQLEEALRQASCYVVADADTSNQALDLFTQIMALLNGGSNERA